MVKLIVFSDENKFNDLIQEYCNNEGFREKYRDTKSFYSEEVIYISEEGNFEFGDYSLQKIKESPIIILRDIFENESLRTDLDDFCMLRHTDTPYLYTELSEKCKEKIIQQQEEEKYKEEETIYYHLSKFIGNNENITYTSFFEQYIKPKIDIAEEKSILDIALEFLCHGGKKEELDNLEILSNFDEIKTLFNDWKKEGNQTSLPENLCRAVTRTVMPE